MEASMIVCERSKTFERQGVFVFCLLPHSVRGANEEDRKQSMGIDGCLMSLTQRERERAMKAKSHACGEKEVVEDD
jgi:hypothetical protein